MQTDGTVRVSKEQLEKAFSILKFREGKWKRKTQAAAAIGVSRPTLDKILALYPSGMPEKPKKTTPVYFTEFTQTRAYKELFNRYLDRKTNRLSKQGEALLYVWRDAFKARGKKDPLDFDLADYLFFFGTGDKPPYPDFVDPQTNSISFHKASALRICMALGRARDHLNDPRFTTKGLKREKGRKRYWYLELEHIISVCNAILEPDTLIFFYLGILLGGRGNALRALTDGKIHREAQTVEIFETKVSRTVEKDLFDFSLALLWQYVIDFNIKGGLFYHDLDEYNRRLIKASHEAGLPENLTITSHMLKHTCVTQMSLHDVDIDVISDYVGTDPKTLLDFYRGGGREKIRAQILNLPRPQEKWKDFVSKFHPYFVARYNYLKPFAAKVDGIKARVPA